MNVQNVITNGKPTVISTFAGCGGSSLGYKWAGYKELLAIDFDDNCEQTFKANFQDVPFWNKDICQVTTQQILDFCHVEKGELDVLDGSPPCQGFSTAGKREVNDERNDLFKEYIRLINGLQPKVFIMENVSGMVKGSMKGRFIEIMKALKQTKYIVKCKLLNAKYYNVPQSRRRLFFIGIRNDLNKEPIYPLTINKVITVKEALLNLNLNTDDLENTKLKKKALELWEKCKLGKSFSTVHPLGHWFNAYKTTPNKPSNTIIKTVFVGGMGNGIFHYNEPRLFSIKELKRLASFPDDFQFVGSFKEQWARIGNAVMPKQMEAVAKVIKEQILEK